MKSMGLGIRRDQLLDGMITDLGVIFNIWDAIDAKIYMGKFDIEIDVLNI